MEKLPIKLPENINLNTNGNPLDHQSDWKKITIEGKQASIKVPSPEYNLYIELENGKVYLTPEQEIDYTYNLSIENKSPNNYIGDFKSSEADVSFEIRINLQSGAIIRK